MSLKLGIIASSRSTTTPTPAVVTSGMVLYLDAGNVLSYPGTGTMWTDLTLNGNNGTLTNGASYNSNNGGSILFDGTNDYVSTGRSQFPSALQDRTAQIWFKKTNSGTVDVLFGYGSNANGSMFGSFILDTNLIYFWGFNVDTSIGYTITTNVWYNLAFTLNSGVLIAYINGSQVSTFSPAISTVIPTLIPSNLGINIHGGTNAWHGNISIYMIYNRALLSSEVLQNFNANKSRYGY